MRCSVQARVRVGGREGVREVSLAAMGWILQWVDLFLVS